MPLTHRTPTHKQRQRVNVSFILQWIAGVLTGAVPLALTFYTQLPREKKKLVFLHTQWSNGKSHLQNFRFNAPSKCSNFYFFHFTLLLDCLMWQKKHQLYRAVYVSDICFKWHLNERFGQWFRDMVNLGQKIYINCTCYKLLIKYAHWNSIVKSQDP